MTPMLRARSRLVAQGLLTADFRLTETGNAFVDAMIASLNDAPPPLVDSRKRGRRWS